LLQHLVEGVPGVGLQAASNRSLPGDEAAFEQRAMVESSSIG
jgi:hypothetical protein